MHNHAFQLAAETKCTRCSFIFLITSVPCVFNTPNTILEPRLKYLMVTLMHVCISDLWAATITTESKPLYITIV